MHGLIKTHKEERPVRVITSGYGTAIENLSVFAESAYIPKFWMLNVESKVHLKCLESNYSILIKSITFSVMVQQKGLICLVHIVT